MNAHSLTLTLFLGEHFPSADQWVWHRACAAIRGENVRRNDNQSLDATLAADTDIRAAWDAYIVKLHAFYTARDGGTGFLGFRGARS